MRYCSFFYPFILLSFLYTLGLSFPVLAEEKSLKIKADKVIYEKSKALIQAIGHVEIYYKDMHLTANKLDYNQTTKEFLAIGDVKLDNKNGEKIRADSMNLAQQFKNILAQNLYIETKEKGYFFAHHAEQDDEKQSLAFNEASYTACKICQKDDRPTWKITAKHILWDREQKEVYFYNSKFNLFNIPVFWLPYFQIADPTVKRKTGILAPHFISQTSLGMGVEIPLFLNLAPSYDLTLRATPLSKQGFLGQLNWRQKLKHGAYTIDFAHIYQNHPDFFQDNTIDNLQNHRFLLASKGLFQINPWWQYGFDVFLQSDKNFGRTYNIDTYNQEEQASKLFLSGLKDYNYFDLSLQHFSIQESLLDNDPLARASSEPFVLPEIIYEKQSNAPIFGSVIDSKFYFSSLYFQKNAQFLFDKDFENHVSNYGSWDLNWQKRKIFSNGIVFSPSVNLTAKDHYLAQNAYNENNFELMPTLGGQISYPILIETLGTHHYLEPIAQAFISTNENKGFNQTNDIFSNIPTITASNLFQRNRFLSVNRIEGGTRVNAGVRYQTEEQKGWNFYGLLGQSVHLLGQNSLSSTKGVNHDFAFHTEFSDLVGLIELYNQHNFSLSFDGNLRPDNKKLRRAEINLNKKWQNYSVNLFYNYSENPYISVPDLPTGHNFQREIGTNQELQFNSNWSISFYNVYDLATKTLTNIGGWLGYNNDCLSLNVGYQQKRTPTINTLSHSFQFSVSLLTIGSFKKPTKDL